MVRCWLLPSHNLWWQLFSLFMVRVPLPFSPCTLDGSWLSITKDKLYQVFLVQALGQGLGTGFLFVPCSYARHMIGSRFDHLYYITWSSHQCYIPLVQSQAYLRSRPCYRWWFLRRDYIPNHSEQPHWRSRFRISRMDHGLPYSWLPHYYH